jgi:hypothetical protein
MKTNLRTARSAFSYNPTIIVPSLQSRYTAACRDAERTFEDVWAPTMLALVTVTLGFVLVGVFS